MKYGVFSALLITVIWAVLALGQLWTGWLSAEVFTKLTITCGVLVGVIVLVTLVIREYLSEKKLKEDGFID